jgi:ceramide glucosyltransferase
MALMEATYLWASLAVVSVGLAGLCQYCLRKMLSREPILPRGTIPISVLKPLKGIDDELENNLESFCLQSHPEYEIIMGAADPGDPALDVARRVRARHPELPIRVITGEWPDGENPKVRLLRHLAGFVKHGAFLISDSNVRVRGDYLAVMAGALGRPNVGMVSNLVVGVGEGRLGAAMENLVLNGSVAGMMAVSCLVGRHPTAIGKSILVRRDALARVGGFGSFANVLAEDYLLGRAVSQAAYRVVTLGHTVMTVNRSWSLERTFRRHLRWSVIRRSINPVAYTFEILMQPTLWTCFTWAGVVMGGRGDITPGIVATVALVASWAAVCVMLARLKESRVGSLTLLAVPLVGLMAVVVWCSAWFVDSVEWRGRSYRVAAGSRLVPKAAAGTIGSSAGGVGWA